uniref:sphingomyelin phosphodiesterase n=1 Tax=Calidris pygmaea TaxID=425635 RepID=A0A8C3KP47_9CHAR
LSPCRTPPLCPTVPSDPGEAPVSDGGRSHPAAPCLRPQLLGHPLPEQAAAGACPAHRGHAAPGGLRPGASPGGVERAGLQRPEGEAGKLLPLLSLLPQWGDWQRPLCLLPVPHPGHTPLPVLAERVPLHGEWAAGGTQCHGAQPHRASLTPACSPSSPQLQHGDWFCGKSVGLIIIKISGIIFNVYVTHLHAEYCREKDAYLPHRLVQAWELAQFIRHTSKAADVVLVGGDLNMHPEDVGIRLLRGWTGLRDAFAEATRFEGCEDGCTLVPNNCFTVKSELLPFPLGIRIDYILYKAISSFTVKCEELKTTMGTAPGMDIPFSDHEAVMATLQIRRQGQAAGDTQGTAEATLADVVTEARTEVGVGLRAAQGQRYSTGRMAVLALLLLLLQAAAALGTLAGLGAGQPFPKLSFALLAFLAIGVLLLATGLHLFHTMEVKMLQGTEEQMRMALRALQERPSDS